MSCREQIYKSCFLTRRPIELRHIGTVLFCAPLDARLELDQGSTLRAVIQTTCIFDYCATQLPKRSCLEIQICIYNC